MAYLIKYIVKLFHQNVRKLGALLRPAYFSQLFDQHLGRARPPRNQEPSDDYDKAPACERISWAYDLVFPAFPLNMINEVADAFRCFKDASHFIRRFYFNFAVFLILKTSFICYDVYVERPSFFVVLSAKQ